MKKILIYTLLTVMLCVSVNAETVAYWRFEEGTNGEQHDGDNDNFYVDQTANNNDMSTIDEFSRPFATNDVPFSPVPQTGAANTLALDFFNQYVQTVGSKMVDSYNFTNGWTIEATVKFNSLTGSDGNWPVIIGKDGEVAGAQPFYLKLIPPGVDGPDAFIQPAVVDDTESGLYWFDGRSCCGGAGITPIQTGLWYSLAVTYDVITSNAMLYIKEETDLEYEWEASSRSQIPGASIPWDNSWAIGRGMHNSINFGFTAGTIDEVRISDGPLNPTQFLAYAEILTPQPPAIKNVVYSPNPEPSDIDTVQISSKITTINSTLTNTTYQYKVNSGNWIGPFDLATNAMPDIYTGNIISQAPNSVVSFKLLAVNADGQSTTTDVSTYTVYENIPWETVLVTSDAIGGGYNMPGMAVAPNGFAGFTYRSVSGSNAQYIEESGLGVMESPVAISTDLQGYNSDIVFGTNNEPRVILSYDVDDFGGLTFVQRTNGVWTTPMMIVTNFFNEYRGVITIDPDQKSSALWYQDDGYVGELIDISLSGDSYSSAVITNEVSTKPSQRRPFGMITGTDGKRRLALSYRDIFADRLYLGEETSAKSGDFNWETITTNKVYAEQMGYALDGLNNAYIVCRKYTTEPGVAVLYENSSGPWIEHTLDPMGHWGHAAVAVDAAGVVWVVHNIADASSPNGLKLWSNRDDPNVWQKEQSVTNGIYIDSIAGFGITELGTMKVAFKPDYLTQNLVYMYSTKFTIPEGGIVFSILFSVFGIFITRRRQTK